MPSKTRKKSSKPRTSTTKLTYNNFDFETFTQERHEMEEFRKNCYTENMEAIWKVLKASYLPRRIDGPHLWTEYDLDPDGTAIPSRYFLESDDETGRLELNEPLTAVKVHTAISLLTQRTPDVRWDSDNSKYQKRVPVINALRKQDWLDEQIREQYAMMWFYNTLFGTTFWRRFYEKIERDVKLPREVNLAEDKVEFKDAKVTEVDQVSAEALSPLQTWIDPGTQPLKPRTMRKIKYDKVFDYQNFRREFDNKENVDKKALNKVIPTSLPGNTVTTTKGPDSDVSSRGDNLVRVEYYENKDLDLHYVVANDVPIIKEHLPYNHKELSVLMGVWMPRSDENPYGLGPIEMMLPSKKALDEFSSMTLTQTKFSIYKAIFYTGNLTMEDGEGGDIHIRPDRLYKSTDPKSITPLNIPGPGADSWRAIDRLRDLTDENSGITKPLSGEITKATAFETDLAKDAALTRMSLPINNIANLLRKDAELTFELQKQFYSLPEVEEIIDIDVLEKARQSLDDARRSDETPNFSLFVDETDPQDPRIFKGTFRTAQLSLEENDFGEAFPTEGKQETIITPDVFDWRGRIHVVADSLLTITPTIERTKKMEFYNLVIPMFQQPPELVAKPARELAKLYQINPQQIFPSSWLKYLESLDNGEEPEPSPQQQAIDQERQAQQAGASPQSPGFQQRRADRVVTNVGGQRNAQAAASQALNPQAPPQGQNV